MADRRHASQDASDAARDGDDGQPWSEAAITVELHRLSAEFVLFRDQFPLLGDPQLPVSA